MEQSPAPRPEPTQNPPFAPAPPPERRDADDETRLAAPLGETSDEESGTQRLAPRTPQSPGASASSPDERTVVFDPPTAMTAPGPLTAPPVSDAPAPASPERRPSGPPPIPSRFGEPRPAITPERMGEPRFTAPPSRPADAPAPAEMQRQPQPQAQPPPQSSPEQQREEPRRESPPAPPAPPAQPQSYTQPLGTVAPGQESAPQQQQGGSDTTAYPPRMPQPGTPPSNVPQPQRPYAPPAPPQYGQPQPPPQPQYAPQPLPAGYMAANAPLTTTAPARPAGVNNALLGTIAALLAIIALTQLWNAFRPVTLDAGQTVRVQNSRTLSATTQTQVRDTVAAADTAIKDVNRQAQQDYANARTDIERQAVIEKYSFTLQQIIAQQNNDILRILTQQNSP